MTATKTRMLNIGDKVQYHGNTWGRGPSADRILYCHDGDIAEVVEFHEAVRGTGLTVAYDSEGEPIKDTGWPAYVVVRLANGLTAAIEGVHLQTGEWTRV